MEVHSSSSYPSVVMDRCVLLNWFIDCFIHWDRNCTWYQGTHLYISWFIVDSIALCVEQSILGTNSRFGQRNSGEKTNKLCRLCDRYGHLARKFRLRNIRLKKPYQDVDRMYSVDRRLKPRRELFLEGTRLQGVVTVK